ncbi:unnamed protein product [Withania somnifera]
MKWVVQDLPQMPNIECYSFNCTSPFHPGIENYEDIPTIGGCFSPQFWEYMKIREQIIGKINCGELYNSSRVIEGLYLDLMAKEYDHGLEQWATSKNPGKLHKSLDWLVKQECNSVIFMSFGTTTLLCDQEIKVLAIGLEKSRQKFIWVLADVVKGDVFTSEVRKVQLLEGYEDRIRERVIIVRDWAPQLEILAHSSTGGFMSHCGWNSCMETMSFGYVKIGLIVRPWARRDEHVTSEIVESAFEKSSRVEQAIKKSVKDGGVNNAEMDSFIAHIAR